MVFSDLGVAGTECCWVESMMMWFVLDIRSLVVEVS